MDVIDSLQLEIYQKLSEHGYNVFDVPELNTPLPFVKLGDINYSTEKNKLGKIYGYDIRYELHIWNEQGDKQASNYMVKHIEGLLYEIKIDDYNIIDINIEINYTDYTEVRQAIMVLSLKLDI